MFATEAAVTAGAITGAAAVLSFLRTKYSERTVPAIIMAGVIAFIVNFLYCWAYYWWDTPAHTGMWWGYSWTWVSVVIAAVAFGIADATASDGDNEGQLGLGVIAPVIVALIMLSGMVIGPWTVRDQSDADNLAKLVQITTEDPSTYPDTDVSHIVQVPVEYAKLKASTSIGKALLGDTGINLSTAYKIGDAELQAVNGKLYWIFSLQFTSRQTMNQVQGIVPGYIAVDAEDPDAEAVVRQAGTDGKRFKLKYNPDSYYGDKLDRQLYNNGYAEYKYDDLTLEVDDSWVPFYTAALNKATVHNSGEAPQLMVVIDPQTGIITPYPLNNIPAWIDRVYSDETVTRFMTWWGEWGDKNNPYLDPFRTRPDTGRYKTSTAPELVYTTASGHPAWQLTMTSRNADSSITDIVLFDARSNRARLYSNVKGTPIESQVAKTMEGIPQNSANRYAATHIAFHQIYGQPTWVANYTLRENGSYQGIGFFYPLNSNGTTVAYARTKEEALTSYRLILARKPDNQAPGQGADTGKTISGTIGGIAQRIENGNTIYLIWLSENPSQVFKAGFSVSLELPFAKVGDKVVIKFVDYGQPPLDVSEFNDTDIPIVP